MKPVLSRFKLRDTTLKNFAILVKTLEIWWQHFKKKVLKTFILNDYTWNFELNGIDFKITNFLKFDSMNVQSMYQGEEVQEDGEDTDKGYNSY